MVDNQLHQQEHATTTTPRSELEEEYVQAQRAAVESLHIGRATLEQVHQQGEQLERAENLADEAHYQLQKAGRLLRGMTWSGWMVNKFSRAPEAQSASSRSNHKLQQQQPPLVYEDIPESCQATAQAIQNYHANVNVLEMCETDEHRDTLVTICQSMYDAAKTQVELLESKNDPLDTAFLLEFKSNLAILHQRYSAVAFRESGATGAERAELLGSGQQQQPKGQTKIDPHQKLQDDHLNLMSAHLGELGLLSQNLASAMGHQSQTLSSLEDKADNITEQSRMVTRRADRLIQSKSWTPVKATYSCNVSIRHLASGRYLAVVQNKLVLQTTFNDQNCVFSLWKRQGEIFGLKNEDSRKWLGQALLGHLACSSSSFGRREEWEADANWKQTRLLCASVGWGAGGFLQVYRTNRDGDSQELSLKLGGASVEQRKQADLWCLQDLTSD